jgi:hypothetical protein
LPFIVGIEEKLSISHAHKGTSNSLTHSLTHSLTALLDRYRKETMTTLHTLVPWLATGMSFLTLTVSAM